MRWLRYWLAGHVAFCREAFDVTPLGASDQYLDVGHRYVRLFGVHLPHCMTQAVWNFAMEVWLEKEALRKFDLGVE